MLSLQSFLRKGVSLGYVGRNYNLKDLKASALFHSYLCVRYPCTAASLIKCGCVLEVAPARLTPPVK